MGRSVIISVKGNQTSANSDDSRMELVTEGRYYKKGDAYFITYKESEVTGMEGTTTTLKVAGSTVTLMRFGTVNSQMVFEKGQKHVSHYDTVHGAFTVGVYANNVDVRIGDAGGEIHVDYQLEIDNSKYGDNDFYMQVRTAGNSEDECCGECQDGSC